jgi:putative MATE family efflux protein
MKKRVGLDLLNMPVGVSLFKLSYPMLYGIFSITAFNFIDTYFVSMLGTDPLAAMGFTFPVVMLVGALAFGLGIGTTSLVSRTIGSGNYKNVARIVTDSIILSVIIVVVVGLLGFVTMHETFIFLGVEKGIYPLVKQFMTIWYFGVVFFIVPVIGNNAMRGVGDALIPSFIMVVGTLANIVLDPIMIFGIFGFPKMGIAGAALATVMSRALVFFITFYYLHKKHKMIAFRKPCLKLFYIRIYLLFIKNKLISTYLIKIREVIRNWCKILYVGIPAALTTLCIPFAIAVVIKLSAGFGYDAVAAVGAGRRVQALILVVFMALGASIVPFVGQNWGAGKIDRIALGFDICVKFSILYGVVLFVLMLLLSTSIGYIFTKEGTVAAYIGNYLCYIALSSGLQGISVIACRMLTAMNKPIHSALLNIFRFFILYIPLVYLCADFFGMTGIFIGMCIANSVTGLISIWYIKRLLANLRKNSSALCETT